MKKGRISAALLACCLSMTAFGQKQLFKGVVLDSQGAPVMGASVYQKNGKEGRVVTNTDANGSFSISVEPGSNITVSFLGYKTQEVKAATDMQIVLIDDEINIEDAVVIGYGTQKKSVVTAAIARVTAEDLANKAPVRLDNALKGLAAGVNVTSSSGAPGAGSRVQIRGIGTINNSAPLYIVDGMPIEGNIDYLNPSDIESVEVLKDAASGAVYGARAANGVILVTTKKGKLGKPSVNYNFSMGWQTKWHKRDVLNAKEYAILMNEERVNSGMQPYNYDTSVNTDWQDLIFNDRAPVMNHEVSVSGATEKLNYYLSLGYFTQDGIVGGDKDRSNYRRLTMRSNTKYTLFDDTEDRDWLNKLEISANLTYSRIKSIGNVDPNGNSNGVLNSALALSPLIKPWFSGQEAEDMLAQYSAAYSDYVPLYDKKGNLYSVPGNDYDNQINPLAAMALPAYWAWRHEYMAQFAADLNIGWGFKYRLSYGADVNYNGYDNAYNIPRYLGSSFSSNKSSAWAASNRGTVWQIENVLTWDKQFGKHGVNIVLGQSAKKSTGWYLSASRNTLTDFDNPYIDNAVGDDAHDVGASAGPYNVHTLSSMFARGSYNYDERYMFQFTVRRDGSSRFGSNNHYAVFPSFSLGWNVTNESFMQKSSDWLNNLKVRLSWGKNGNENIGDFGYAVYTSKGHDALFGTGDGNKNLGVTVGGLANPDLKWEESVQTDFGLDFGFLHNQLTFSVDYYVKKTDGMLIYNPVPSYVSNVKPWGNVGKMKNSGIEFELGYKVMVGEARIAVKANAAYLKNKLVNLGNESGYQNYDNLFGGLGFITRGENGQPFPFFYGYKTAGIFQNEAEVLAYVNEAGELIQPNAKPGDFRYVDVHKDGVIDEKDMTKIGKGTPDWTFGLNFNAEWKGFDFNMFWQGTAGNDVYDASMRFDRRSLNLPTWMLNRWTGEGTSNSVPRFEVGSTNFHSSDMYVFNGSYLRLKNLSIGYTLPEHITKKFFISNLRVFAMAENVFTFTKYHGYDPEMTSTSVTSVGIDYGSYPQSRTFSVGVNVTF